MKLADELARKRKAGARSGGRAQRPIGHFASSAFSSSGIPCMAAVMPDWIRPGAMAFTRIRSPTHATAEVLGHLHDSRPFAAP